MKVLASHSRSLRLRFAQLAVVLCVVTAWMAQIGHFALVEHTLCSEHGELVHGDGHGHASAATADAAEQQQASNAADLDHEHDHCHAVSDDSVVQATAAELEHELIAWTLVAWMPTSNVVVDGSRRFAMAPKNSPPQQA